MTKYMQTRKKYYDQLLELDLSKLEPYVNGPFTPDLATPISQMKEAVIKKRLAIKARSGINRKLHQLIL